MKRYSLIFTLSIILFAIPLYSEEKSEEQKYVFSIIAATKGIYSSGVSDTYTYNKSSITGEMQSEYIDISASIHSYFNYQLNDGSGTLNYYSFNEAGLSITAYLFDLISLTGEYNHADDFRDLNRNNYSGGIEFYFLPVVLSADYSYEVFEYQINSANVETDKHDFSSQLDYQFSDLLSADIGYNYSSIYFNTLGYSYEKNLIRAGMSLMPTGYLYIIAGAGGGKDSAEYYIFSADCGITIKAFSRFKFTLVYNFAYYYPPAGASSASSSTDKKGPYSYGSGSSGSSNPYITEDKTGDPFYSHVISLGMSVTF